MAQSQDESKVSSDKLTEQSRLQALLNALPDLLFVLDKKGNYTQAHASDPRELVVPAESMIGRNVRDLPLSPAVIGHNLEGIRQILQNNVPRYSFDYSFVIGDETRHYNAQMARLNDEEVLVLVRDITSLHQTQETLANHIADLTVLRQLDLELTDKMDANYISLVALDASFRITNATAGFVAQMGENNRLVPLRWLGDYDEESLEQGLNAHDSLWRRALDNHQAIHWTDVPSGEVGLQADTTTIMAFPLMSQEQVTGLIGLEGNSKARFTEQTFEFLRLIVGRVASSLVNARLYEQTQEQLALLRLAHERVSRLEQIKTDMIRIASHDLRNPLSGMMGYLDMLRWQHDQLTDEQRNYLQQIERATRRMQAITTGILSLERIEQLANQQHDYLMNIGTVVRQVCNEQMPSAEAKQLTFEIEVSDASVVVAGDNHQLYEAISNLIQNAIKYTPEGGTVNVRLFKEADHAIFEVSDTGYGIPQSQQERIFSPFFRAKMNETSHIEGTGLGLHLVRNIIQRHQGFIAFESKRGKGSTFTFRLPLAMDEGA